MNVAQPIFIAPSTATFDGRIIASLCNAAGFTNHFCKSILKIIFSLQASYFNIIILTIIILSVLIIYIFPNMFEIRVFKISTLLLVLFMIEIFFLFNVTSFVLFHMIDDIGSYLQPFSKCFPVLRLVYFYVLDVLAYEMLHHKIYLLFDVPLDYILQDRSYRIAYRLCKVFSIIALILSFLFNILPSISGSNGLSYAILVAITRTILAYYSVSLMETLIIMILLARIMWQYYRDPMTLDRRSFHQTNSSVIARDLPPSYEMTSRNNLVAWNERLPRYESIIHLCEERNVYMESNNLSN